jgi:hypothetical protein
MSAATNGVPRGSAATVFLRWRLVAGITFYWHAVLTGQGVEATTSYLDFARAFPRVDALLAASAVPCAGHLRRRRPAAVLWALITAGALGVVGVVGVTYNLQHGIYDRWSAALAWEVYVNAFSLVFPVWLACSSWSA